MMRNHTVDPEPPRRRIHVYCYQMDDGRWRAQWTADFSRAWIGNTPEEAIESARHRLANADPEHDVKAMVVQIEPPETQN